MNNYYDREDDVQDTPEVELDNLTATEHSLSTVVTQTAERLNRTAEITEWLYPRQQNEQDMGFIRELYESTNIMGTQLTQAALAHKQAGAFAKKMFEMYQGLAGDMQEVCGELDKVEGDLVDMRHDFNRLESEFKDTMTTAYQEIFTEMHESIREITGCGEWVLVHRFTDMLVGNDAPTDQQRRLLSELVATFFEVQPEQV